MTWRNLIGAVFTFFVVLIALAFASNYLRFTQVDAAYEELEKLENDYIVKRGMARNLDEHRRQLREINRMFGDALMRLPSRSDRTFEKVRAAAKARGLRLEVLAPPKLDWRREHYVQTPARIVLSGRFHQVGEFIADVGRMPASMRIAPFVIERSSQPGMVTLRGVLLAYRSLSEAEIEAQRKEAAKQNAEGARK